ncbi:unnamed protein product [Pleuronectes platessa]|uniref:Uncharacterized protein n=1 Tax=Pleuronectes platessa TaxID=8262 RepID=A0A9N7U9H7_PLEPL|nr:unnamed protein product [Pleuronectes platessa]
MTGGRSRGGERSRAEGGGNVRYRRAASLALSPPGGCGNWLPDAAGQSSRVTEIPLSATHRRPSPNGGRAPCDVNSLFVPTTTAHSLPLSLSSPACQLIRTLADTLIRVSKRCSCVCLLLIPPRGMACGTARPKPLSVPCVEERDKTKKTATKMAVREEAVIAGGICVAFPQERKREQRKQ